MSNVIVTNAGLSQAISAGGPTSNGPLFPIKYFTLVYDPRLDENIHTVDESLSTDVMSFSATVSASDTSPIETGGESIFNVDGYTISSVEHLIISGDEVINLTTITGSTKNNASKVNLYNGLPLLPVISGGDTLTYNGSGSWLKDEDNALVSRTTDTDTFITDKDNYFDVDSFSPIGVTSGSGKLRGLFKCRVGNQIGNFKFNKIALYQASFSGGVELDVQPTLVAMASLNSPITKTIDGNNITNVEVDIEVEFNVNGPLSDIAYMTNDYWTNITPVSGGGLYYDGDVAIGTSGLGYYPKAKLDITDQDKGQLRLNNIWEAQYVDFEVNNNGTMTLSTSGGALDGYAHFFKDDNVLHIEGSAFVETLSANDIYTDYIRGNDDVISILNTEISASNIKNGIGGSNDIIAYYANVDPGTTDTGYGFKSFVQGSTNDSAYGGYFEAKDGDVNIGVRGTATHSALVAIPTFFAGGYFNASSDGTFPDGSTIYGMYATVTEVGSSTADKWAGYFNDGDVYIKEGLTNQGTANLNVVSVIGGIDVSGSNATFRKSVISSLPSTYLSSEASTSGASLGDVVTYKTQFSFSTTLDPGDKLELIDIPADINTTDNLTVKLSITLYDGSDPIPHGYGLMRLPTTANYYSYMLLTTDKLKVHDGVTYNGSAFTADASGTIAIQKVGTGYKLHFGHASSISSAWKLTVVMEF